LTGGGSAQEPAIGTVLARAAAYVAEYQKRLSGIVAEEFYRQNVVVTSIRRGRASGRQYRELRSDVLLVRPGADESWMQFRDVFEVDRKPVRDRDERLYKLFVTAKPDRREQAATIQAESARYNIGPVQRTINIPIMALLFFELGNQYGLRFERVHADHDKRFGELAAKGTVWTLEYREVTDDTMVRGAQGLSVPSHGRAWIDSATGRILRTEHVSEDTSVRAVIDVTYKAEPGLDLLVPAEMRENYLIRRSEVRIDSRATYSRFRQFTVITSEKPKG
jgi:hypothetical protein